MSSVKFAPILRVKKKPRGRSFEPGNGFGAEHRFVKGQPPANPGGRPKCKEISKALRERLASDKPIKAKTGAEKLANAWYEQASDGNIAALVSLADRCEGRPATTVVMGEREDVLGPLLESVQGMYELEQRKAGVRQLTTGDENEDEE